MASAVSEIITGFCGFTRISPFAGVVLSATATIFMDLFFSSIILRSNRRCVVRSF
jgi:hypothetical protein